MSEGTSTKTVRLTIDLNAYNKNGCAIVNYKELVAKAVEGNSTEDDSQKEKKYRRSFAELGAGYDDSDSFIDNTELEEGGEEDITEFYVNSKKLKCKKNNKFCGSS